EQYQALAEEWGVSPREARLIARILELYPDMTAEEVLALTFEERMALIRDEHKNNGNMTAGIHAEYREAVEALKEQYPELSALEEQLKEIGRQLTNPELTEEERAALTEQLETLKATYRELKEQFKTEAEALREQLKEAADAERERIREEAEARRAQHEEELKKHEEEFRERKEETEERIRRFRGGK
ncbi:MAG: hypothetical protein ACI3XE_01145, partial [Eubacteriales bacterium]